MIQAIAATHDLGHPPFGHGGEVALNYCMRSDGGFEGNGQTLRILVRLEKFSAGAGANLTRRTLLGVLKYPAAYSVVVNSDPAKVPRLQASLSAIKVIASGIRPDCSGIEIGSLPDDRLERRALTARRRYRHPIRPEGGCQLLCG